MIKLYGIFLFGKKLKGGSKKQTDQNFDKDTSGQIVPSLETQQYHTVYGSHHLHLPRLLPT